MSVGAVLLQPQRLRRAAAARPGAAEIDDGLTLAARIAYDAARGGQILPLIEQAAESAGERLVATVESGLDDAVKRAGGRLTGLISRFEAHVGSLGSVHDPDAALATVQALLGLVGEAAAALTIERLRTELTELVHLLEDDLGLKPDVLEQQTLALLDDVVHRLASATPEADADLRRNRMQVAALLRRQRRRLGTGFEVPALDAERLAEQLAALLRDSHVTDAAARVACVGSGLASAVGIGRDLLHAVPFTGFGATSLGGGTAPPPSDSDPYCWYASWATGNDVRGADPTASSLFTSADGSYTFKHFAAGTVEDWAYATAVGGDALQLLLHLLSLEEGDYASNSINAVVSVGAGAWKLSTRSPMNPWIENLVFRGVGTLGGSFEGMHTKASFLNCFKMWSCTLLIPDVVEMYLYKGTADLVRDLVLSSLTLLNYDGPGAPPSSGDDKRPLNRLKVDAWVDLAVAGLGQLMLLLFPKKDYEQPFASGDQALRFILLWQTLINSCVTLLGITVGLVVAELLSQARDLSVVPRQLYRTLIRTFLTFPISLYQSVEGGTSGGTFNPFGGADFMGYDNFGTGTPRVKADNATSPYKLPYAPGSSVYCVQGNQGLVSHNFRNAGQLYAYDFSLDQDVEVLAARPGTIVAWWEDTEDDTNPDGKWNFVAIRHDVDDAGNPLAVDQNFDLGPGGTPVRTIAVYGHGRKGSVTKALALSGRTPPPRVGSSYAVDATAPPVHVKRGMPVMLAGSTGISFNNHLHIHVIPDEAADATSLVPTNFNGTANTMPFVFADVDRFLGTEGLPEHLNWYTSKNTRVTS